MDIENNGNESPTNAEVISPMVASIVPKEGNSQKGKSKVYMMSPSEQTGRKTVSEPIRISTVRRGKSWEKSCKRFGSLCMAVFLFAGGIVSISLIEFFG